MITAALLASILFNHQMLLSISSFIKILSSSLWSLNCGALSFLSRRMDDDGLSKARSN